MLEYEFITINYCNGRVIIARIFDKFIPKKGVVVHFGHKRLLAFHVYNKKMFQPLQLSIFFPMPKMGSKTDWLLKSSRVEPPTNL